MDGISGDGERPLSVAIMRVLGDKLYDRRKTAALEVEHIVRTAFAAGDSAKVVAILGQLGSTDFASSTQSNFRKGGLIGLAACAIGLGDHALPFLPSILSPVLRCLVDQDSRVRYYACEALYNSSKVLRGSLMPHFNEVFDVLCKLIADSDPSVQLGAHHVDRLMKDVVTECDAFDMDKFVPLLAQRVLVRDPHVRQFVISWVSVLDSVPLIDMVLYLPHFLGGILEMLGDARGEVRGAADTALADLMRGVAMGSSGVDMPAVGRIAVQYAKSGDPLTCAVALRWLTASVALGGESMDEDLIKSMVDVVLPCRSHEVEGIRKGSLEASRAILSLIQERCRDGDPEDPSATATATKATGAEQASESNKDKDKDGQSGEAVPGPIRVAPLVACVVSSLPTRRRPTRKLSLLWLSVLLDSFPRSVALQRDLVFPVLIASLRDRAEDVAVLGMDILCRMCTAQGGAGGEAPGGDKPGRVLAGVEGEPSRGPFFLCFVEGLLQLCRADPPFLTHRLPTVLRRSALSFGGGATSTSTSSSPDACDLYLRIGELLSDETDFAFARSAVERLVLVLLTCEELSGVREVLACLGNGGNGGGNGGQRTVDGHLFPVLFRAASHSPGTALLLALVSRRYSLARRLVLSFERLGVTLGFLVEMDRVVRFVEAPVLARVRLDLLGTDAGALELAGALRGVLMTLPQGKAYAALRGRLEGASVGGAAISTATTEHLHRGFHHQGNVGGTTMQPHGVPSGVPSGVSNGGGNASVALPPDTTMVAGTVVAVPRSASGEDQGDCALLAWFVTVQERHAERARAEARGPSAREMIDAQNQAGGAAGEAANDELGEIPSLQSLQVHTKSTIITLPE